MAALAYVLLPFSGLLCYLLGHSPRVRFHGLQAIALGALWPALLYVAGGISEQATRLVALIGAIVWIGITIATAAGKDLHLPVLGARLRRVAEVERS
ncbi:MAG TPA: hypothetical protein VNP73_08450 [Actinomycetota bacterium]|nr:hypothetical protein [Actinomycetota bacterium]